MRFDIYIIGGDIKIHGGCPFTRVEPVWPGSISSSEYYRYSLPRWDRGLDALTPNELGCSLAHCSALQQIIDRSLPGLVLEHDVTYSSSEIEAVSRILSLFQPDFLHLSVHDGLRPKGKNLGEGVVRVYRNSDLWGASAYYITPSAAAYLLAAQKNCMSVADDFTLQFYSSGFKLLHFPMFTHPYVLSDLSHARINFRPILVKRLLRRKVVSLVTHIARKLGINDWRPLI